MSDFIGLKMRYEKGVNGAVILNGFFDYAIERERSQLSKDVQIILASRLAGGEKLSSMVSEYQAENESRIARLNGADVIRRAQLNHELKALRVRLRLDREARLVRLEEAISVARSLGSKRPPTPFLIADEGSVNGDIIRTQVNGTPVSLCFMGVEVLESERAALRKCGSDDFVESIVGQSRQELILYSTNREVPVARVQASEVAFRGRVKGFAWSVRARKPSMLSCRILPLVNIDQHALLSSKPLRPRKALIVLVAFIGGLLLGTVAALLRGFQGSCKAAASS
ncbi:hypothetical protein [Pseudomonas sp. FGI182]|uniref:hypothetical protein n=1 Tax=Pseudomonas sp. FGI182 TaxID=1259844 RepID=UPI0012DC8D22|nr:hypothetical protein [Pseudomonas sp. FGI182]